MGEGRDSVAIGQYSSSFSMSNTRFSHVSLTIRPEKTRAPSHNCYLTHGQLLE